MTDCSGLVIDTILKSSLTPHSHGHRVVSGLTLAYRQRRGDLRWDMLHTLRWITALHEGQIPVLTHGLQVGEVWVHVGVRCNVEFYLG